MFFKAFSSKKFPRRTPGPPFQLLVEGGGDAPPTEQDPVRHGSTGELNIKTQLLTTNEEIFTQISSHTTIMIQYSYIYAHIKPRRQEVEMAVTL